MARSKSPFLDLPTELRLQIYAYALAPTASLFLTQTRARRFATVPALPTALLRTNRQIHAEAAPFLAGANEIAVTVDAHDTCWPTLAETRLPQRVLEQLEYVFIVLDCTQAFLTIYANVDFDAFGALTALRTLRLAVIYDAAAAAAAPTKICGSWLEKGADVRDLLAEVLARIPRRTRVLCEVPEGSPQMACVESVMDNRMQAKGRNTGAVRMLAVEDVEAAVKAVSDEVRGSRSGVNEDVFAGYHERVGSKASMWKLRGLNLNLA